MQERHIYNVKIEGPRLTLREFQPGDAPGIYSYASRPELKHMLWEPHTELATSEAALQRFLTSATEVDRATYTLAVIHKSALIGGCRIGITSLDDHNASIGYVLHPDLWGQGLGTELAAVLIQFGFRQLRMHRIWATCFGANLASRRVMEKAGMLYEGVLRGHKLVRGEYRDCWLYAVQATDPRPPSGELTSYEAAWTWRTERT